MATVNGHAELDPVLNPVSSSLSQSPPSLIDPGESTDTSDEHHEHGVQNGNGEAQPAENAAEPPQSAFVRRSSRRSMPVKPFDSFGSSNTTAPTPTNGSRRNPKRKASDPVKQLTSPPGELLKEALRPLEPSDIEDWEGWIELESEPVGWPSIRVTQVPNGINLVRAGILHHNTARPGHSGRQSSGALYPRPRIH